MEEEGTSFQEDEEEQQIIDASQVTLSPMTQQPMDEPSACSSLHVSCI